MYITGEYFVAYYYKPEGAIPGVVVVVEKYERLYIHFNTTKQLSSNF